MLLLNAVNSLHVTSCTKTMDNFVNIMKVHEDCNNNNSNVTCAEDLSIKKHIFHFVSSFTFIDICVEKLLVFEEKKLVYFLMPQWYVQVRICFSVRMGVCDYEKKL